MMPKELFPSSYECDCGHQLDFCENTVNEMKRMSMRKKQYLGGSDGHKVVFFQGEMVDMICPNQKPKKQENSKKTPRKKTTGIPDEIKTKVSELIEKFNKQTFKDPEIFYVPRYKGKYLYLNRNESGDLVPICRLEFNGKLNNWGFALYKYSDERYDPNEFFSGMKYVNGTIAGAMKAGMKAYPD